MTRTLIQAVLILILTGLISCSKNDRNFLDCTNQIRLFTIDFHIVNDSGEDLFFSPNAPYIADSLNVFKIIIDKQQPIPFSVEEDEKPYFKISVAGGYRDTCFISLSPTEVDTLVYIGWLDQQSFCSQFNLDTVLFNGTQAIPDIQTGIFKFVKNMP